MALTNTRASCTMADANAALRIAGGLDATGSLDWYNVEHTGPSADRMEIVDAVTIACKATDFDPNRSPVILRKWAERNR